MPLHAWCWGEDADQVAVQPAVAMQRKHGHGCCCLCLTDEAHGPKVRRVEQHVH